ncbi:MAG TPA: hypothetical protein DF427_00365 [Moraxellaceae bacterium]|nr:hypothetical protein [Moraxellaceae bacterium]
MLIKSVEIKNYKSFLNSGEIKLSPGFNIIVGRNDAGKSALLEAISIHPKTIGSRPHRSPKTCPKPGTKPDPISVIKLVYELTSEDIVDALSLQREIFIPVIHGVGTDVDHFEKSIRKGGEFHAIWSEAEGITGWLSLMGSQRAGNFLTLKNTLYPSSLSIDHNQSAIGQRQNAPSTYGASIADNILGRTYAFRAERLNVGVSTVNGSKELKPNAENLPDVLNQLISSNPSRYERLMCHIRSIFPHITQITAPITNGSAHISVWSVPIKSERSDLAVPLSESGTGIGQVLSMLYVVVTSDAPKIIIIDEPQSFLHPGAARKLLDILRQYSQHQYIITTHSPIFFNTEDSIQLIQKTDFESSLRKIDQKVQDELKLFLSDIGARLSDVFGADSILWVEGRTEEICFPEIIEKLVRRPLNGLKVLGVISTDELSNKHANRAYEIYKKISSENSLLPPAISFIFDKEGRSETERKDIVRKSGGLVTWLPRRMFENFLIDPKSIAHVINENDTERDDIVTEQDITSWLEKNSDKHVYPEESETKPLFNTKKWRECVHGAKLLQQLFQEITNQRVEYRKVMHGLSLCRQVIDNPTDDILELSEFLKQSISQPSS